MPTPPEGIICVLRLKDGTVVFEGRINADPPPAVIVTNGKGTFAKQFENFMGRARVYNYVEVTVFHMELVGAPDAPQ